MPTTAAQLSPGQAAFIADITCIPLSNRLYDMGISPGCTLELLSIAPCGDPRVFLTPACVIALRQCDCRCILISCL